jgi:hypothetical protein
MSLGCLDYILAETDEESANVGDVGVGLKSQIKRKECVGGD